MLKPKVNMFRCSGFASFIPFHSSSEVAKLSTQWVGWGPVGWHQQRVLVQTSWPHSNRNLISMRHRHIIIWEILRTWGKHTCAFHPARTWNEIAPLVIILLNFTKNSWERHRLRGCHLRNSSHRLCESTWSTPPEKQFFEKVQQRLQKDKQKTVTGYVTFFEHLR